MTCETIRSDIIYHGRAFDVRRDQVRLPDGQIVHMDIVDHVGAVTLIPVDDQGRIWFVRQYRQAAGETLLELPAGMIEVGERPETCARREIREEIGMAAGKIQKIGEYFLAPGYSTEFMHVYLATDLHPDPLPGDVDEFLSVEAISIEQAFLMAENGEIRDAKTLATLLLARPLLS
jgi:ADP-ribose pyrophosphatase